MTTKEAFERIIPILSNIVNPSTAKSYKRRFLMGTLSEETMDNVLKKAGYIPTESVKVWDAPAGELDLSKEESEFLHNNMYQEPTQLGPKGDEVGTLEIGTEVLVIPWGEEGEIEDNEDFTLTGAYTVKINDESYFVEKKDIQVIIR